MLKSASKEMVMIIFGASIVLMYVLLKLRVASELSVICDIQPNLQVSIFVLF